MSSITTTHAIPDEVVRYCQSRGLLPHLETALRLADECFQPIHRLAVSVEPDPEVQDEEKVVIDIWLTMSVDEAVGHQSAYNRRWVDLAPPEAINQIVLIFYLL